MDTSLPTMRLPEWTENDRTKYQMVLHAEQSHLSEARVQIREQQNVIRCLNDKCGMMQAQLNSVKNTQNSGNRTKQRIMAEIIVQHERFDKNMIRIEARLEEVSEYRVTKSTIMDLIRDVKGRSVVSMRGMSVTDMESMLKESNNVSVDSELLATCEA